MDHRAVLRGERGRHRELLPAEAVVVLRGQIRSERRVWPSAAPVRSELNGTSGTCLNVLLVIPALLMNVVPTRSTVTP